MRLVSQEDEICVFFCKVDLNYEQAALSYEEVGSAIEDDQVEGANDDPLVECYDCGVEIDSDNAHLTDRDGSPVYVCFRDECQ